MAIAVEQAIWELEAGVKPKGNALLVLLAFAHFVIQERVKAGQPALVFPSQETVAKMCNCSRSTVQLALEELKQLGLIRATGERKWGKYKGTAEYEILPGAGFSFNSALTDSRVTESRSAGEVPGGALTDPRNALTDPRNALTDPRRHDDRSVGHKQAVKQVIDPVIEAGSVAAAPDARGPTNNRHVGEPFVDLEWIALDERLRVCSDQAERKSLGRRRRELLGDEVVMDMWALRLLKHLDAELAIDAVQVVT